MRTAWLMVVTGLVLASRSSAADPLRTGTISFDTIDVKAGPGWNMAKCGVLKKGQTVVILREENDFYAIQPLEGSVSWVNYLLLGKPDPNLVRQNLEIKQDVQVRIGSEKGPTDVAQMKLPKGQIVEVIGEKQRCDNTWYYPIDPPKGEVRFIPKSSVSEIRNAPVDGSRWDGNAAVVSRTKDGVPGILTSRGAGASNIGGAGTGIAHALWPQAEQAYQNAEYAKAEELFRQIYQDMNKSSNYTYDEKLLCYNRRMKCVDALGSSRNSSDVNRLDGSGKPVERSSNWGTNNPAKADGEERSVTSKALLLRRAAFTIDGKQAYALVGDRGDVAYYVTAQPGVSMDSSIGKVVEATGTPKTRGDLGVPYMMVSRVSVAK